MYNDKSQKLDEIIKSTLETINESKNEILEISNFAKKEYIKLEEEFLRLRIEANYSIEKVDSLEIELKNSKNRLSRVSKDQVKYSQVDIKEIYFITDNLRIQLAVEKEKEYNIIKRRNELEVHLRNIRNISEKADNLSNNFGVAVNIINGELTKIGQEVEDISKIQDWGIRAIQIQEMERQRIARDMHDGPTQSLTNLIIKTEVCIKLLDNDIDQTKLELQTLRNLIRNTIDETRRLIYNLRPMLIDDLGLVPTLERLVDKFKEDSGISIKLLVNDSNKSNQAYINSVILLTLYRVAQEALNNICKHANATKIKLVVLIKSDNLILSIEDNGIGFDIIEMREHISKTAFGLLMLKERVGFLGGKFSIQSKKGKGTIVQVEISIMDMDKEKKIEDEED